MPAAEAAAGAGTGAGAGAPSANNGNDSSRSSNFMVERDDVDDVPFCFTAQNKAISRPTSAGQDIKGNQDVTGRDRQERCEKQDKEKRTSAVGSGSLSRAGNSGTSRAYIPYRPALPSSFQHVGPMDQGKSWI